MEQKKLRKGYGIVRTWSAGFDPRASPFRRNEARKYAEQYVHGIFLRCFGCGRRLVLGNISGKQCGNDVETKRRGHYRRRKGGHVDLMLSPPELDKRYVRIRMSAQDGQQELAAVQVFPFVQVASLRYVDST